MTAFANATAFFHACESLEGWDGCQQYVASSARFTAQSEPIAEIDSVQDYCDWMAGLGSTALAGCCYELHSSSFDKNTNTALFFGTFIARHTGEDGPVPPTGKKTESHYVYAITMDEEDKVRELTKIWNAPWSMRELGWAG